MIMLLSLNFWLWMLTKFELTALTGEKQLHLSKEKQSLRNKKRTGWRGTKFDQAYSTPWKEAERVRRKTSENERLSKALAQLRKCAENLRTYLVFSVILLSTTKPVW
jgi:hypothetical protein